MRLALGIEQNSCWSVRRIASYAREWKEKEDVEFRRDPEIRPEQKDLSAVCYRQRSPAGFSTSTFIFAYGCLKRPALSACVDPSFPIRQFSTNNQEASNSKGDSDGVLRCRGIPFGTSEAEVIEFFHGFEIAENGVSIPPDARGRPGGEAYVKFASQEVAAAAMVKHREKIGHRYIEIFESSLAELRGAQRFGINKLQGGMRETGTGTGYVVHMRGLPFRATENDVLAFFAPLVPSAIHLRSWPNGKATGDADVEFESHADAQEAMKRNMQYMDHRYVELFLRSTPDT